MWSWCGILESRSISIDLYGFHPGERRASDTAPCQRALQLLVCCNRDFCRSRSGDGFETKNGCLSSMELYRLLSMNPNNMHPCDPNMDTHKSIMDLSEGLGGLGGIFLSSCQVLF